MRQVEEDDTATQTTQSSQAMQDKYRGSGGSSLESHYCVENLSWIAQVQSGLG